MPKLAFFYATFPRPTETFVRRELKALIELGIQPEIFSIWGGEAEWQNIKIRRFCLWKLCVLIYWLPYWAWRNSTAFREILSALWNRPCPNLQNWNETFLGLGFALVEAKRLKNEKFDLFHGVWATMPATATFALSRLTDTPFSMGAHAYDLFRRGGDWLLIEKFKYAAFIRTSSKSSFRRLHAMGLPKEKIHLIQRGLSYWPERKSFELKKPAFIKLISVGRLVEKKGYFCLLRILQDLSQRNNCEFEMKIVGSGPLHGQLSEEIARYGLSKKVFLLGSRREDEVRELFLEADVKLFTGIIDSKGDRDGIPNVIPEAMSAGCLILASNYAGASEAFVDRVSGYEINPRRPREWVEILEEFAKKPDYFISMRKKAQLYCKKRFDIKNTARSLHEIFLNAIITNE